MTGVTPVYTVPPALRLSSVSKSDNMVVQAVEALEAVRVLVMDKVGQQSLLAQRPGKRMAKHKSKAISATLMQRSGSNLADLGLLAARSLSAS